MFAAAILIAALALLGLIVWLILLLKGAVESERAHRNARRLQAVLQTLGDRKSAFPAKMAAAHELRSFPAQREVILRACEKLRFDGTDEASAALKEELDAALAELSR